MLPLQCSWHTYFFMVFPELQTVEQQHLHSKNTLFSERKLSRKYQVSEWIEIVVVSVLYDVINKHMKYHCKSYSTNLFTTVFLEAFI